MKHEQLSTRFNRAPRSRGKTLLLKYMEGRKLRASEAILAKCAECMGLYVDGLVDCGVKDCPLFEWRPYKKQWRGRHSL